MFCRGYEFESETFREYFFSQMDIVLGVKEISHPRCSIYSFVKRKKFSKSFIQVLK